jgi:hypothetical protein
MYEQCGEGDELLLDSVMRWYQMQWARARGLGWSLWAGEPDVRAIH